MRQRCELRNAGLILNVYRLFSTASHIRPSAFSACFQCWPLTNLSLAQCLRNAWFVQVMFVCHLIRAMSGFFNWGDVCCPVSTPHRSFDDRKRLVSPQFRTSNYRQLPRCQCCDLIAGNNFFFTCTAFSFFLDLLIVWHVFYDWERGRSQRGGSRSPMSFPLPRRLPLLKFPVF